MLANGFKIVLVVERHKVAALRGQDAKLRCRRVDLARRALQQGGRLADADETWDGGLHGFDFTEVSKHNFQNLEGTIRESRKTYGRIVRLGSERGAWWFRRLDRSSGWY